MAGARQKSKKNGVQNTVYKSSNRRLTNKVKDLKRHIANFPNDLQANKSLALILKGQAGVKGKRHYTWQHKDDKHFNKGNMAFAFRQAIK